MTATVSRQPAGSYAAGAAMDSVDSYVARVLSVVRPLQSRPLSLAEADGAVLAEDVWACCPLPCFDNSAMDGYAVAALDVASATPAVPVILPVDAEVAAGDVELRQLTAGSCMRIMTGALMPAGADAVVRVEWTDGGTERVAISAPVRAGCDVRRHRLIRDDRGDVLAAVREALTGADMLVTSGGISMGGEHDAIKAALRDLGTLSFGKVAMQPGMPQGFGTAGPASTPIITLPGNPVSAFVSFRLFVTPAVRALQGLHPERPRRAVLTAPLRSPAARRSFTCGVLDHERGTVTPAPGTSTHQLTALARSNALIVVPERVTALAAGAAVEVLELHQ